MRKIGILTGGGDCPGLNAVIRGVVEECAQAGIEVYGFSAGWRGAVLERSADGGMSPFSAFAKTGWRIVILAIVVFVGTYIASAIIAQCILKALGQI